jgi:hypothetical protein
VPLTYYASSTASDLTGSTLPTVHNQALATSTAGLVTKNTGSIPAASSRDGFAWTASSVPGTGGYTLADYQIKVDVSAGNASIELSVRVARVNSAGTVQAESSATAEQTASAGVKTFNLTGVNLGIWVAGDRLRIRYIFRNTHGSMTQAATIRYNGTDSIVTATEIRSGAASAAMGLASSLTGSRLSAASTTAALTTAASTTSDIVPGLLPAGIWNEPTEGATHGPPYRLWVSVP